MLFMLMKFQVTPDDLLSNAQVLNYADKDSQSPTSIVLNKDYLKDLFFNQTPAKVSSLCTDMLGSLLMHEMCEKH